MSAAMGLLPGEVVLRGGNLPAPLVLSDLKEVGGKLFFYLYKTHKGSNAFLTKTPMCQRPLARTLVPERLATLRNSAVAAMLADAPDASASGEPDFADLLALDSGSSSSPTKSALKRQQLKQRRNTLPATVEVTLAEEGLAPWTPTVLVERMNKVVAMEATESNFQSLFAYVAHDFGLGDRLRQAPAPAQKPPRGPQHARQYWTGSHWITKVAEGPATRKNTSLPAATRFRTLKRRGSDEQPPGPRARQASRRGANPRPKRARGTRAAPRDEVEDDCLGADMDCLGVDALG